MKTKAALFVTLDDLVNPDLGYACKLPDSEWAFIAALELYGTDLPTPLCQYKFADDRRWRFDFAWAHPGILLAVEVDGGTKMFRRAKYGRGVMVGGRHNSDGDLAKINQAQLLGWKVLRYSITMLADGEAVIGEVRKALGRVKR